MSIQWALLKPTRRWIQFSVRTLLVLIAAIAVLMGVKVNQTRRQRDAVAAIQALGGWVHYDYQIDATGRTKRNAKSWVPDWLIVHLGIDLFHDVVEVNMVYNDDGPKRLDNKQVGDEVLEHLPALTALKYLLLHRTQASDERLQYVGRLKHLESLLIGDASDVSDAGIEQLKNLRRLKYLHVSNSQITDKAIKHLASMKQLEGLSLQGNRFSDKGLEHVRDLTKLKSLVIDRGEIHVTDDGLVHLRGLKKLERLGLQQSLVTDHGLKHLSGLTNLKDLWLDGTSVTATGVEELKRSLPKLATNPSTFPQAEPIATESQKDESVQALEKKCSLNLKSAPLDAVLTFFHHYTGLEIVRENAALERVAALSPANGITVKLENVRVRSALEYVLQQVDLSFLIRDNILVITDRDTAQPRRSSNVAAADKVQERVRGLEPPAAAETEGAFDPAQAIRERLQNSSFELVAVLGDSRFRHWNYINAIAFSPDGKKVGSVGQDGMLRVWDFATGIELWSRPHTGGAQGVAFTPDSEKIASCGGGTGLESGEVVVCNATTGAELLTFKHPVGGGGYRSVAFSPNGHTVAAAGGEIELWDVTTAEKRPTLAGHQEGSRSWAVPALAFSPDGKTLASGGTDQKIRIWDLARWRETACLTGHNRAVQSLVFSPDGRRLVSGSQDGTIKVWDLPTAQELSTHESGRVRMLCFRDDGKTLLSADDSITVRFWNLEAGTVERTIELGHGFLPAFALSPDGQTLAWASRSKIQFLDLASGQERSVPGTDEPQTWAVEFNPDGRLLATGSYEGVLQIWDTASWQKQRSLRGHSKWVSSVAFSPDGTSVAAVGDESGTLTVWDVATGAEQTSIGLEKRVFPIAYGLDGNTVAVGEADGFVRLWNLEKRTDAALDENTNHIRMAPVRALAFSHDGQHVVCCRYDGVKVWHALTRQELHSLQRPLRAKEQVRGIIWCVAISPDGQTLAAGEKSNQGIITLWDPRSGDVRSILDAHRREVLALEFSPDGRTLVSAGDDGTLRNWDFASGELRETVQLGPPDGEITQLAFNSNGTYLAVLGGNGAVYVLRTR